MSYRMYSCFLKVSDLTWTEPLKKKKNKTFSDFNVDFEKWYLTDSRCHITEFIVNDKPSDRVFLLNASFACVIILYYIVTEIIYL